MSASDFPALSNDRLLRALRREPVDRTPVWMMRQAGRYLPEYRATRAQAGDFMSLCKNADLACEVTLQPLRRYPLDAAILFSDILTIPDAMGLQLYFENGEGPRFKRCIRSAADVAALPKLNAEVDLDYVMRAVHTIRHSLAGQVPLIGFSGSPWTLATYMIEGAGSKDFALAKAMLYRDPDTLHALLTHLATAVTDYLLAQIKAGVQVVQVFDTWGGALAHHAFQEFSLQYMTQIVACIKESAPHVPIIVFTKGAGQWLELMADSGADALGLDWTTDLGAARRRVGNRVTLQGNMDPAVLYAEPEQIRQEVQRLLARFGPGSGHVFNLGHGITPGVDPEAARVFIEAVVEFSPAWHEWGTDQASAST